MADQYTYQVARVRVRELHLLNRQDIDGLMAAKTYEDCLRAVRDKGWGTGNEKTAEEILTAENAKTWDFVHELVKDDTEPFNVLLFPIDFNNLKAAVKLTVTGSDTPNVFKAGGTVDPELMLKAVKEKDFSILPEIMAEPAERAFRTLLQTGDGQMCDIILDRASLDAISASGKESHDELIKDYAKLKVAISDIKIAVRCCKTKKSIDFIKEALAPCDSLDIEALTMAAVQGLEEIYAYLSKTDYSAAIEKLKESASAFEKWCDDKLMAMIKGQKDNHFTVGPIVAYIIARQNEISCVRIILSGKNAGIDDRILRERLREMYV